MFKSDLRGVIRALINDDATRKEVALGNASKSPVVITLKAAEASQGDIDFAVRLYLKKYRKGKERIYRMLNYDHLRAAEGLLSLKPSRRVIREVVREISHSGGGLSRNFADLTQEHLGRNPTPKEVVTLIDVYVNDFTHRSSDVEKELKTLVSLVLPPSKAGEQIQRIDAFVRKWSNIID